jgi:hypothetical protein
VSKTRFSLSDLYSLFFSFFLGLKWRMDQRAVGIDGEATLLMMSRSACLTKYWINSSLDLGFWYNLNC